MTDTQTLPQSSVPAAFDRGHLYSPTRDYIAPALRGRYDYQPGDLFEPMPEAPREPKEFAWWWRNVARQEVPDFLGLRVGDRVTIQHVTSVGEGEVIATRRSGAVVRYLLPVSNLSDRTHAEMYVRRRNDVGHWYP
ncbi:hypothetical protein [Streptomyces sp. NRRL S-455]|uniref:hypothetical protein n=1 Tax=Streptomyces sp. NRRL S-455 TaxID=1463908 RepID=UPI0004C21C02|nr:hypothetical protein [Streptomyces sp. NRRL S-455]